MSRRLPDPTWSLLVCVIVGTVVTSAVGCKTREVGSAPSEAGTLLFEDDFERSEIGDRWERGTGESGTGKWRIEDGWLHGSALKNDPLWLADQLPDRVRVEFEARALSETGDIKVEMFGDGKNHASGYIFIFGGWNNSLDVIARLDEHGDDRKARTTRKVEPERVYQMAIERSGSSLKWFVDGELFMSYDDDEPLRGKGHAHFAFSNWMAPVAFDNVRVYRLRS